VKSSHAINRLQRPPSAFLGVRMVSLMTDCALKHRIIHYAIIGQRFSPRKCPKFSISRQTEKNMICIQVFLVESNGNLRVKKEVRKGTDDVSEETSYSYYFECCCPSIHLQNHCSKSGPCTCKRHSQMRSIPIPGNTHHIDTHCHRHRSRTSRHHRTHDR